MDIYIFSPQYSHLDGRIRGHPFGTPPPALPPEPLSSWTRHRARDLPVAHVKRKLASSSKRCNQKVKLWFIPSWIMARWLNYPSEHIHKFTARSLGWDVPDVFIAPATSDYRVRVSPGGCALYIKLFPLSRGRLLENHLSLVLWMMRAKKSKKFNPPDSSSEALSNIRGS